MSVVIPPHWTPQEAYQAGCDQINMTTAATLRAEVARLWEAIEQAPHESSCNTRDACSEAMGCDCWKSHALSKGGDR
jgi:hypothetical protein